MRASRPNGNNERIAACWSLCARARVRALRRRRVCPHQSCRARDQATLWERNTNLSDGVCYMYVKFYSFSFDLIYLWFINLFFHFLGHYLFITYLGARAPAAAACLRCHFRGWPSRQPSLRGYAKKETMNVRWRNNMRKKRKCWR